MKLVAHSGPLAGQELPIDKPVIIIGRGTGCDIWLEDQEASRRHSEIRFSGGQVSISDLGSMNGTFVNGVRIQAPQVLHPGDEIRIGTTRFTLQEGMALAQPSAASILEAPAPPVTARSGPSLGLIIGGIAVITIVLLAGVAAFVFLRGQPGQATTGAKAGTPSALPGTPSALQRTPTQATSAPQTTPTTGATATSLVVPFATFTPAPATTGAPAAPGAGGAPVQPGQPSGPPPFTVTWSPGRYEGWAEGRRMSSDLTIKNISLPQIAPPYAPYFIISDAQGNMRLGELRDYSSATNRPPTLLPGQSVTWTWFTIMTNKEWVRGSVFRYGGYSWAQEFNPDGSLNGAPRPIDESTIIPFLPKQIPPEVLATLAAGGAPTGIPSTP